MGVSGHYLNSPVDKLQVELPFETVRYWADHFLPSQDVWYWDDSVDELDLTGCEVLSRKNYLAHPAFRDIRFVNAFLHWQMPSDVTRVIVSDSAWIDSLSEADRRRALQEQVKRRRGLVFPETHFDLLPQGLEAFVVDGRIVMCHAAWDVIPEKIRHQMLVREQHVWDEDECLPLPQNATAHVRSIANTFRLVKGGNCLATTAFCVTGNPKLIDLWMFPAEFSDLIAQNGYQPVPGVLPDAGDVVTFKSDGAIVHAAYCMGLNRFVSKNGQSRFNPIRIVDWERLSGDWPTSKCLLFSLPKQVE